MEIRIENITDQEITFSWDAVQGADSYRLLWKDRKRESMQFKALLTTKEHKGTLKKMPRIPYYVKVQALLGEKVLAFLNSFAYNNSKS